jgi:MFS family permease
MVVGTPGVIMAIIIKLIIREPPRGHSDPVEKPLSPEDLTAAPTTGGLGYELSELASVAKSLFLHWPILNMVLGVTLASFAGYGVGQFSAPYFIRTFGLNYATVGLIFGLIGGLSSGLGTLIGGFVSDFASRRNAAWYALTPAIGLAIATPIYLLAYTQPEWRTAALILFVPGIFHYTYLGPTFGVIQNVVETRRRATATALLFFFLNFIALGGGTYFTGWLIDHLAQYGFTHPGAPDLVTSLQAMVTGAGPGGELQDHPGRRHPRRHPGDDLLLRLGGVPLPAWFLRPGQGTRPGGRGAQGAGGVGAGRGDIARFLI